MDRQAHARAAGTKRNHKYAVGVYLAFCCRLHIQPYDVTYQDLCVFIEYIASHTPAPATVRNKISSLRVHFALMDNDLSALNHPRVIRALEALERNKDYIPRIKEPIEPHVFYNILCHIPNSDYGYIFRAAILTLYSRDRSARGTHVRSRPAEIVLSPREDVISLSRRVRICRDPGNTGLLHCSTLGM